MSSILENFYESFFPILLVDGLNFELTLRGAVEPLHGAAHFFGLAYYLPRQEGYCV